MIPSTYKTSANITYYYNITNISLIADQLNYKIWFHNKYAMVIINQYIDRIDYRYSKILILKNTKLKKWSETFKGTDRKYFLYNFHIFASSKWKVFDFALWEIALNASAASDSFPATGRHVWKALFTKARKTPDFPIRHRDFQPQITEGPLRRSWRSEIGNVSENSLTFRLFLPRKLGAFFLSAWMVLQVLLRIRKHGLWMQFPDPDFVMVHASYGCLKRLLVFSAIWVF